MRVAIVGGPGVGEEHAAPPAQRPVPRGAYGEGEEGVWDPGVLEDIDAGRNPVGVTEYLPSSTMPTIAMRRNRNGRTA